MIYLIAQCIGFVAFIISLTTYHKRTKSSILKNSLMVNFLKLIHYILLDAYSGFFVKIMAIIRDLFVMLKEKYKVLNNNILFFIFIIVYILIAIISYENLISLLPILAAVTYMFVLWYKEEIKIKKVALFGYFCWLIYNFYILSIPGVLSNIVSIISVSIAINKSYK